MGITISADDPRSIRAIEIAAEADRWQRWHTPAGDDVFGVPSQSHPGRYYAVTTASCECPDFLRSANRGVEDGGPVCKHILAVRLYCELVRAEQHGFQSANTARRHLRLVR